MNPNALVDPPPPQATYLNTEPSQLIQIHHNVDISFIKQEADLAAAAENYFEDPVEYEVESILQKKVEGSRTYYLVKWKGFDLNHATWEPRQNLKNAPAMIKEFEKKLKGVPYGEGVEVHSGRGRKPLNNSAIKVKKEESGTKDPAKKKEKDQSEKNSNGLIVKMKRTLKEQNQEVTLLGENVFEEAKLEDEKGQKAKKRGNKETTKKIKLETDKSQKKRTSKKGYPDDSLVDSNQPLTQQMFLNDPKSVMLNGSTMGYPGQFGYVMDRDAQNILNSIKKENIDTPSSGSYLLNKQAIAPGALENSFNLNGYGHHPDHHIIGINIHHRSNENSHSFSKATESHRHTRKTSEDSEDASYIDSSDSQSVEDSNMEPETVSPYGSLENGDIPIKVIGIRPLLDENDLEIMMAWKPRANGDVPEDSRVKRFDLLKRGLILPLIEYYEQKMQLGSAPSFNASMLAKKQVGECRLKEVAFFF